MKRMLGCFLVAAVACLSLGVASAAGFDTGQVMTLAPDLILSTGVLTATVAAGVPLSEAAVPVTMRAKLQVGHVLQHYGTDGTTKTQETVMMHAVSASKYPEDGSDEDNTYAKFSPGASLSINIANPALFGKFKHGQKFYADFTEAAG